VVFDDKGGHYTRPTERVVLTFDDVNPELFSKLLQCLYTDDVTTSVEEAPELIKLAGRFHYDVLRMICVDLMQSEVKLEDVCATFATGVQQLGVQTFGLAFIEENSTEVFETQGWLDLPRECVAIILKSNSLSAEEIEVFTALDNWAAAECKRQKQKPTAENKKEIMGDLLQLIRFPLMEMQDVVTKLQPAGYLSSQELLTLFTYFGASKENKPKILWNSKPREASGGIPCWDKGGTTVLSNKDRSTACNPSIGSWNSNAFISKIKKTKTYIAYSFKIENIGGSRYTMVGFVPRGTPATQSSPHSNIGCFMYLANGSHYGSAGSGNASRTDWKNGDVMTVKWDGSASTVVYYVNGVQYCQMSGVMGTDMIPCISHHSSTNSGTFTLCEHPKNLKF